MLQTIGIDAEGRDLCTCGLPAFCRRRERTQPDGDGRVSRAERTHPCVTMNQCMTENSQVAELVTHPPVPRDSDGIDLLDVSMVLASRRRMIAIVTFASLVAGMAIAFTLKPYFIATAVILPPQEQQSAAGVLLSQLGSLSGLGAASGMGLGMKSSSDMYMGILQSRTIADEIIDQFHLKTVYKTRIMEETRLVLKKKTQIESGKDGLIRITVTDRDPGRASALANAYVKELYGMNSNLAMTEAAQRRVFFDQQLEGEKKALAAAEDDLRATPQRTGLIQLSGQAQMIIRTIADLRAQIASREVELQATRTFATEQNPDVARQQEEISAMRAQLAKLENDQARQVPGDTSVPAGQVPEDSLEYARKLREVKYHETLFDLLSRQFEAAKIDEAKSAPIIQVIDQAVPPDKKAGPHRLLIGLAFGFVGFCLSLLWVFWKEALRRMREVPASADKLDRLQLMLRER
jgi:tyrosine-protein kinase Etk/Wzc